MEIPLEKILLSTFTGAVGVVVFAYALFFFSGRTILPSLLRIFARVHYLNPSNDGNTSQTTHAYSDLEKGFFAIVAVAGMYSVGVLIETVSYNITHPYAPEIRYSAYGKVFGNTRDIFTEPLKARADRARSGQLTHTDKSQINLAYYRAKNLAFKEATYFTELREAERVITFMATLLVLSGTIVALVLALAVWKVLLTKTRVNIPTTIRKHCAMISWLRLFVVGVSAAILCVGFLVAWRSGEDDFTLRCFGYYIDSETGQKEILASGSAPSNSANPSGESG